MTDAQRNDYECRIEHQHHEPATVQHHQYAAKLTQSNVTQQQNPSFSLYGIPYSRNAGEAQQALLSNLVNFKKDRIGSRLVHNASASTRTKTSKEVWPSQLSDSTQLVPPKAQLLLEEPSARNNICSFHQRVACFERAFAKLNMPTTQGK